MRARIAKIALDSVGLGRKDIGEQGRRFWCGAFACHVLRQAGLAVPCDHERPGFGLTRELYLIDAQRVQVGDIIRYISGLEHYAIIAGIDKATFGLNALIVEGTSNEGKVTSERREISMFAGVNWGWPREYYSIEPLIERYNWTGAATGEIA